MNATEIGLWFAGLAPAHKQAWLDMWGNGGRVTAALVETLPTERRPGKTGAWVLGPTYAGWTSDPTSFSEDFHLSDELRDFLDAEYGEYSS